MPSRRRDAPVTGRGQMFHGEAFSDGNRDRARQREDDRTEPILESSGDRHLAGQVTESDPVGGAQQRDRTIRGVHRRSS